MDRFDKVSERQGSLQNVTVGKTEFGPDSRDTINVDDLSLSYNYNVALTTNTIIVAFFTITLLFFIVKYIFY